MNTLSTPPYIVHKTLTYYGILLHIDYNISWKQNTTTTRKRKQAQQIIIPRFKQKNEWLSLKKSFFLVKKIKAKKKEERKYITEKITHKTQRSIQFSTQCSWCLLHKKIAKLNLKVPSSYFSSSHHHCHSVLKLEKSAFSNVCLCVCVCVCGCTSKVKI